MLLAYLHSELMFVTSSLQQKQLRLLDCCNGLFLNLLRAPRLMTPALEAEQKAISSTLFKFPI